MVLESIQQEEDGCVGQRRLANTSIRVVVAGYQAPLSEVYFKRATKEQRSLKSRAVVQQVIIGRDSLYVSSN